MNTKILLVSLSLFSVVIAQSGERFGLTDPVPQQQIVETVKKSALEGYVRGATARLLTVGSAVRYLAGIYEKEIMDSTVSLGAFLQTKADLKPPRWIVPVYVNDELLATLVVVKEKGKPFSCVAENPHDVLAYALEEITARWSEPNGYHPVIVEIDHLMNRKFLYIPELQYGNLTYITFYPGAFVDAGTTAKKSKFMKYCIANGLTGSSTTDDVRRVYQAWRKNYAKQRAESSLRKSTSPEPSEFNNASKFEDTKAWWKTLNLPGT